MFTDLLHRKEMTKNDSILHPIFIVSLVTLLLNDLYLKQSFSNQLTGKFSDFEGLIVFPIFIAHLLSKSKKWICIVTAILYILWKTSLVSPLIDFINNYSPLETQRVIDYTDYWALLVLPFAHKIINQDKRMSFGDNYLLRFSKIGIAILSCFAICATSMPPAVEIPEGTIYIGEEYVIKKPKEEIIHRIKSLGYNADYHENLDDSTARERYRLTKIPYYQTDNIVIYDDNAQPIDTILNIKYTLFEVKENKTKIEIINVTVSEGGNIQRWQTLKFLRRQYKKMLEQQMIKKVK